MDGGMVEDGKKRGDESIEPPAEGSMVDELGDLDPFKPENGPHGVNDPAGVEIALADVRVNELDDGSRVIQALDRAEVVDHPANGQTLARISPGSIVHSVPFSIKNLNPIFISHQRHVVVVAPPKSNPDFIDDPPHQGLENLNLPFQGQKLLIPPGGEDHDYGNILFLLDLLHFF